jgi:hypothetical protein
MCSRIFGRTGTLEDRRRPPARQRSEGSVAMPELHFMAEADLEIVQAFVSQALEPRLPRRRFTSAT